MQLIHAAGYIQTEVLTDPYLPASDTNDLVAAKLSCENFAPP
jgi:hypothetical protein